MINIIMTRTFFHYFQVYSAFCVCSSNYPISFTFKGLNGQDGEPGLPGDIGPRGYSVNFVLQFLL